MHTLTDEHGDDEDRRRFESEPPFVVVGRKVSGRRAHTQTAEPMYTTYMYESMIQESGDRGWVIERAGTERKGPDRRTKARRQKNKEKNEYTEQAKWTDRVFFYCVSYSFHEEGKKGFT